ncbi:MAG: phytanoyl-CoA dioxygenase family protein [Alphaproteobacteria bacterium]|nr:phytanoyl-CoA dioxygenase family protein [Alphaproteobacteria bacterium]
MRPFTDSTGIAHDGAALRQRMAADGYLFLRGLMPRQAILEVRRQLLELAAAGGWLKPGSPPEAGLADPAAACKDPEERYLEVFRGMWVNESLHKLKRHPAIVGLFERLFGEAVLAHPLLVLRNIFPARDGFDFTTRPHQDRIHIGGATSYAAWMPLGDCPQHKGALVVASGTHQAGVLDFAIGTAAGGLETVGDFSQQWVGNDFLAGDVLVFRDTAVHQALPNRSQEIRQSFDCRYQPASQPISDLSLRTYADMFTWDEVYRGWQDRDEQYYWLAQQPHVVPYDTSYYEKRDAIAYAMAERGEWAARDTLLRIVQRDQNPAKRERASRLLVALQAARPAS